MKKISKIELKELVKLKRKKNRLEQKLVIVEGIRLIEELVNQQVHILKIFYCENNDRIDKLLNDCNCDTYQLEEYQIEKLASTNNPQNLVAILEIQNVPITNFEKLIYLDGVTDPGNMGTIIRTASGAGLDGIVLSPDCVDVYNPKCIRASMGTVFFTPIETHSTEWLNEGDKFVISSILDSDSISYKNCEMGSNSTVLVIGSEAHGISNEIIKISDKKIKIPLTSNVESLNAAISAAILISEVFGFEGNRN